MVCCLTAIGRERYPMTEPNKSLAEALDAFAPAPKTSREGKASRVYPAISPKQRAAIVQHIAKKHGRQLKVNDNKGCAIYFIMLAKADGANVSPADMPVDEEEMLTRPTA